MTEELIRPSEDPLLVFISSRQDAELSHARALAIEAVDNYPGMRVWAFEAAPASPEHFRDRYIRNSGTADIVIWLIGSTTRTAIVEEIRACMQSQGKLIAFKLPATERDVDTQDLINKVSTYATWRTVESEENLPAHIKAALTDEMLRRYRDPAPVNHDLFLRQKHRESLAETKRLWITLGVPEGIAGELADDHSIGHKLSLPESRTLTVTAEQGSGKTLAVHRLYQQALLDRIQDHFQPFPVRLNARNISGDLKDQIERDTQQHGTVYTQKVLIIIDGVDEGGRYKANQLLNQAQSYTEANSNVTVVMMTRPLPGINPAGESSSLAECTEDEFLTIASRIAGREISRYEIPYRESRTRLPLFATIVGSYLRDAETVQGTTPSQMVDQMVRRILDDSGGYPEDTAVLLKTLAVAAITSGESVEKALVASTAAAQDLLANSGVVLAEGHKFDFSLAIFREWFAARALVERSTSLGEIELGSDRWVVPLAIAVNSEHPTIGQEVMEHFSTKDPGLASLVLEEVKHNWSTQDGSQDFSTRASIEIGTSIRQAMANWSEGLGPLMSVIGPMTEDGAIPTLAIQKDPGSITTAWYRGHDQLEPVVEIPPEANPFSRPIDLNWSGWHYRGVESTRVWPWTITQTDLSNSLSVQLESMTLALESSVGFHEFAYEFARSLLRYPSRAGTPLRLSELTQHIEEWIASTGGDSRSTITIDRQTYTMRELEIILTKIRELSIRIGDLITEPWPGSDKPFPHGRKIVWWFELYTEERLLQRTNAIFRAALQIYDDMVKRWFPAFIKRHQMQFIAPLRLEGELRLPSSSTQHKWHNASLIWWPRLASSDADNGAFFELGARNQDFGAQTGQKIQNAKDEFFAHGLGFFNSFQILPAMIPDLPLHWPITGSLLTLRIYVGFDVLPGGITPTQPLTGSLRPPRTD